MKMDRKHIIRRLNAAHRNADGTTAQVKCEHCGGEFTARLADLKRGWGRFCTKSCKAISQSKRRGYGGGRRASDDYDWLGVGEIAEQW